MYQIRIFKENDVDVNLPEIVHNLNRICKFITFVSGENKFEVTDDVVSNPKTYLELSSGIKEETKNDFRSIFVTQKGYDNNYFFDSPDKQIIILSFNSWEYLTKLKINNGLVFFIADLIALSVDKSVRHDDNPKPECIYNFRWNKAEIDNAMRSALICPTCIDRINNKYLDDSEKELLSDLQKILNDVGNASKWNTDILDFWKSQTEENVNDTKTQRDRVFISYSHNDTEWLKRLKTHFKPFERTKVIQVWDDTKIRTGDNWKQSIDDAIKTTKVAVLLVSPDFLASDFIANEELPNLLEAAKNEGAVIMPIILKPCGFERIPSISKFQSVNPPSNTLLEMTEGDQERFLLKLSEDVLNLLA